MRLIFLCSLSFGFALRLCAQDEPTAEQLLSYASTLSSRGQITGIGTEGLKIEGEALSGIPVRRPGDARARAAELLMESAGKSADPKTVEEAISLWATNGDKTSSIPYLRMFSQGSHNFAVYCRTRLAETYRDLGDVQSAAGLYLKLSALPLTDETTAYAHACAARFYLSQGNTALASQTARAVLAQSNNNIFSRSLAGTGFTIARAVLKAIPGSELPASSPLGTGRGDFLEEARTAAAAKDYEGAIKAWLEHRRIYPNEPSARVAVLNAAEMCVKIQQPDRALQLYDEAEVQYGAFPEGSKAALEGIRILENRGDLFGAMKRLKTSRERARTPEAASALLATNAQLCAKSKMPDEAAACYAELLTKYSAQDSAKNALKDLEAAASQIKDWKKLARSLQDELANGKLQLTKQELSSLRRLVLRLYVSNGESRQALTWLKAQRAPQDTVETEWQRKDFAWLQAAVAQAAVEPSAPLSSREFSDAIESGIAAWAAAPGSDEGIAGLRAAQALSISSAAPKRGNKALEDALKEMLKSEHREDARKLLLAYYEFCGDKRGVQSLQ